MKFTSITNEDIKKERQCNGVNCFAELFYYFAYVFFRASLGFADTVAPEFTLTTTSDTTEFSFLIGAAGDFVIDWGDGAVETITKTDTIAAEYSHNYTTAGAYTIGISGQATAYSTDYYGHPSITFERSGSISNIAKIDGSLGAIFGTLSSGERTQPSFCLTFYSARNMTGSIPENLFSGIYGAPERGMFSSTFNGCSGLTGSIPENLFAGISGTPAIDMFSGTFFECSGLTGSIPENLFGDISGAPAEYMFEVTFFGCSGLTGSIPENLFGDISGTPADGMFSKTFSGCSGLTGPSARINGKYLYDIWVDEEGYYFADIYQNDTKLSDYPYIPTSWGGLGEKPEFTLTTTSDTRSFSFSISAAGDFVIDWGDGTVETITKNNTTEATYSHNYTTAGTHIININGQATAYNPSTTIATISFYAGANYIEKMQNPRKIAKIDGSLGAIFGTLADGSQPRFYFTFRGGENLKQIPESLFNGITGQPTSAMFFGTFGYCSGIKEIPEKLFAGIYGVPTAQIFTSTFEGCTSLTQIPQRLFGTISGTPASGMFRSTFLDCSGLTSIPENLFSGISGAPADNMYAGTFEGCTSLSGEIPENLFGAIKGAPAQRMYFSTFARDANLSGEIPENLFGNLSGATQPGMFSAVFRGCTSLTGSSARINGKYLYDIWPDATEYDVGMAYSNDTQLDDWPCIPKSWGGPGYNCTFDKFQITTTDNTNMFGVVLGAAGEFVIDWGDGKIQYINKSDTGWSEYTHDYSVSGQYTVKMTGSATAYSTYLSAISFVPRENVYSMSGSLASIFGTLPNGTQPLFSGAFQGCSELIEIPDNLFYGLTGKPAEWMFENTFSGCSSLTDLPPRLFDHFNGASPARSMFSGTFSGCTSLTQIPGDLFAGIYGPTAQELFRSTFSGCSSLTTVPGELFSMLRGVPSTLMFYETFSNCTSLTQIPENLFSSMSNKPATGLFQQTFSGCTSLTQIPAGLFANFSSTEQNMFNGTFQGCTSLTEIPVTLFKNISGNAADNSFESTFWGAKNIDKIIDVGGSYTNWVPAKFFPKLESGANAFDMMFTETALAQECPRYYRRSDVFWAPQIMPKVVCVPDFDDCPIGEYFDTDMGECTMCESGNVCPGGDEPPASCSVITNGEYPMSDTGKSDIADCYKLCEFTSDTCKATAHLDKVYYGYQCTYDCETLLGAPCEIVDDKCKEIECPNAYEYVDYECRPCQRENALSFADMPGCNPDVCASGFHPGANGCYGDSIPCVAANATQAHRQWDSVRNVYGLCTIIECADGYHLVDNVCLPNTGACTLANGIGMREWDFDKNEWGPCVASSCNPGYTNDSSLTDEVGQECGRCFNAYDEYGNLAVSTYVRECEVATCMYQGELYTLENNECRLICGEYSDETGRRYWDLSRKKCIHECMPGFTRW